MADIRCWHCDTGIDEEAITATSVLIPRSARRGGPVVLLRCPHCDVDGLVERNRAREIILSPPTVRNISSRTVRGPVLYAARKWAADHALARAEFLARRGPGPAPSPPPAPAAESEAEERSPPTDEPPAEESVPEEVSGILDAYEVLGLPLTAGAEDARKRYRELARKCHPDRVADLDDEIRRLADRKFRRIKAAFEIILECAGDGSGESPT
jgi:hypothetical protein